MAVVELTQENFAETVFAGEGLKLVDFWADWCGPCVQFAPVFKRVAERHPEIVFGKVDTEAEPELAASWEIRSIPTLVLVRDGVTLYARPGALREDMLEKLITGALELDMDEVRREIAEARAAETAA